MNRQDEILAAEIQSSLLQEELKSLPSDSGPGAFQPSDYEIALRFEMTRLAKIHQELVDRDVAQNLANRLLREHQTQIQIDRSALMALIQEERQAVNDHEAARRLGGVAVSNASTGRARRLIDQAMTAIQQLPHLTQLTGAVTTTTRPAEKTNSHAWTDVPKSASTPAHDQGVSSQILPAHRDSQMCKLPSPSLPNATVALSAQGGTAASLSNPQPQKPSTTLNLGGKKKKPSAAENHASTESKRKHLEFEGASQSPAAKRARTEDHGHGHSLTPVSPDRKLLTPLEAGVGTGGRVFNGSLIQVEASRQLDEECQFLNMQTISSVYDLNKWSLEELRLQDYYHGYKYKQPRGVPQSSSLKRPFGGFGVLVSGLLTGPTAAKRKVDGGTSVEMMKCVICLDRMPKYDSITTKCGHVYCRECIRQLFTRSLSDPELFPPRCCKEFIPCDQVLFLFPGHFKQHFDERLEEFNTPNPIYCPTINCGKFLAPRTFKLDNTASCEKCKETACTKCRAKVHGKESCPADKDLEELRKVGKESNWQICYRCKNLVELHTGCYHITCRCGAEFCYLCGTPWTDNPKACTCAYLDEAHLMTRAQEMAQREAGNTQATQAQTNAWVDRLRENPDCRHIRWKAVEVNDDEDDIECDLGCGDLNDMGFHYMMECEDCGTWACRQCAYNRNR